MAPAGADLGADAAFAGLKLDAVLTVDDSEHSGWPGRRECRWRVRLSETYVELVGDLFARDISP